MLASELVEIVDQLDPILFLAVEGHGLAAIEADSISSGWSERCRGSTVHWNVSGGGSTQGSSRMPASIERPQIFWSA